MSLHKTGPLDPTLFHQFVVCASCYLWLLKIFNHSMPEEQLEKCFKSIFVFLFFASLIVDCITHDFIPKVWKETHAIPSHKEK